MNLENSSKVPGSFRDPSGYLFRLEGKLYRQVNNVYRENYDLLMRSGLYEELAGLGLLVRHEEVDIRGPEPAEAYRVICPETLPFISYPYEWCFSQLKDAALLMLKIQKMALGRGMTLKDCSAYNVQFSGGRLLLIDTLSFEKYLEGRPWTGYRQFCQHFLAPLALMSYKDVRLGQLLRIYLDGVPLDLAGSLLPGRTRLSLPLLAHIHLHARSQAHYADRKTDVKNLRLSLNGLYGIIEQLADTVRGLTWRPRGRGWDAYYTDHNYSNTAFEHKKEMVGRFLKRLGPATVWDLGANTGVFSRVAAAGGAETISFDMDAAAVEINYLSCLKEKQEHILPLVVDLSNPSPGTGWENSERMSMAGRGPADTVLALALVHHLAVSNNVPLERIAGFMSGLCRSLIIEFVPRDDSQLQRMLATRDDVFSGYTQQGFEQAFGRHFIIDECAAIRESHRTLYLMRAR